MQVCGGYVIAELAAALLLIPCVPCVGIGNGDVFK